MFHGQQPPGALAEDPASDFLTAALADRNRANMFGPAAIDEIHLASQAKNPAKTRHLLRKLADLMESRYWTSDTGGDVNDRIPAGYTYLGQLIAHDMVQHVAPFPQNLAQQSTTGLEADNLRHRGLILNTIYGGGPRAEPSAYVPRSDAQQDRVHLRLSRIRQADALEPTERDPFKDVPRVSCPFMNQTDRRPPKGDLTDTLLADARNDDNLILSQLTVLFHTLHNWVFDEIDTLSENSEAFPFLGNDYLKFGAARKVVAFIYRSIVVNDFLKRLLHEDVGGLFDPSSFACLDSTLDYSNAVQDVTVEFSHAAFRIGHAMIRGGYQLNSRLNKSSSNLFALLTRNSSRGAENLPLEANWTVEWYRFFDLGVRGLQPSRRLAPSFTHTLFGSKKLSPAGEDKIFLAHIDMFRAAQSGVRSVDSLIANLPDSLRKKSPLLDSKESRSEAIKQWLSRIRRQDYLTKSERKKACDDPPLLLFVLIEAAISGPEESQGKRLGILGSAIIADSMYRVLRRGRPIVEEDDTIRSLANRIFPHGVPKDMGSLLTYMHARGLV